MTTDTTGDNLEHVRRRTLERMHRCLARLLGAPARDWRSCGKVACLRSRRCRGRVCEPDGRERAAR